MEINCTYALTYANLDLLLLFLCNLGSIHGHFHGFAARCLFGFVFPDKAKQGRWLGAVSTHKSLPHQRTAHWFTMKVPNSLDMVSLLSLPLVMGIAMCFVGNCFESFRFWSIWRALRILDDNELRGDLWSLMVYTGRASQKGGVFFRLQVYERVGISLFELYKRVGKSVFWVCKRAKKS